MWQILRRSSWNITLLLQGPLESHNSWDFVTINGMPESPFCCWVAATTLGPFLFNFYCVCVYSCGCCLDLSNNPCFVIKFSVFLLFYKTIVPLKHPFADAFHGDTIGSLVRTQYCITFLRFPWVWPAGGTQVLPQFPRLDALRLTRRNGRPTRICDPSIISSPFLKRWMLPPIFFWLGFDSYK